MKRFFKVSTNAYDMIVSQEDGSSSCRILKEGEVEDFDYINLNDIEDDSSWDVVETTISEILQDSENQLVQSSQYEAWVMMDSDSSVITEEYETSEEALQEVLEKYTIEEAHEAGFTLNKLLFEGKCWIECLDEIEY